MPNFSDNFDLIKSKLCFEAMTDEKRKFCFKFTVPDLRRIIAAMQIDDSAAYHRIYNVEHRVSSLEGIAIVLRRLAFLCRLVDLGVILADIIPMCAKFLMYNRGQFMPFILIQFSRVISEKRASFQHIVGFIDDGPHAGAMHDQRMLNNSVIPEVLSHDLEVGGYQIYGDQAYRNETWLMRPMQRESREYNDGWELINLIMFKMRIVVKW
ncbi:hypothetical protein EDC96DRAFT_549928 [Choanephora cucurbitarum]|nr:hypothetical protein EDC96DRAFT_549928 [Choanephora cucurbitarum]